MYSRFVQDGKSLNYTPGTDVSAGDIVIRGGTDGLLLGIAKLDIPAHTPGALATEGVYEVVKGASVSFATGAPVYWDDTNHIAVSGTTGTVYIGKAVEAATATAASVAVQFDCSGEHGNGGGGGSITPANPITDFTDNSGGVAGNTIPEVQDTDTADALASFAAKINAILAALRQTGIISQ